MPRLAPPLTEQEINKLLPRTKRYTISDGKNLYLVIEPSGAKRWHFSYRRLGKPTTLSFGTYPETSIAEARQQRENVSRLIINGVDPAAQRREEQKQVRIARPKAPILHISMGEHGGMTIENKYSRITLPQAQVAALKAFMAATSAQNEEE
jgi:hypothetical protein